VAVQVALEVEVRQRLTILHTQQTLQLGIRRDVVLVLQVVVLDVLGDRTRHIGAALLAAGGHTQEAAQLRAQRSGRLEDGRLAGSTIGGLRALTTALALVGLLLEAGNALLQALQLSNQGTDRLADSASLGQHRLHVILDARDRRLRLSGSGRHGRGRGGRRRHRRRGGRRRLLRGRLLGGLLLYRGGRRSRGRHRRGGNLLSLLRHLLGRLGSGGSRAHYTGSRGSIHGRNTHHERSPSFNFDSRALGGW
jgi:hypothetical protein